MDEVETGQGDGTVKNEKHGEGGIRVLGSCNPLDLNAFRFQRLARAAVGVGNDAHRLTSQYIHCGKAVATFDNISGEFQRASIP